MYFLLIKTAIGSDELDKKCGFIVFLVNIILVICDFSTWLFFFEGHCVSHFLIIITSPSDYRHAAVIFLFVRVLLSQ